MLRKMFLLVAAVMLCEVLGSLVTIKVKSSSAAKTNQCREISRVSGSLVRNSAGLCGNEEEKRREGGSEKVIFTPCWLFTSSFTGFATAAKLTLL